jgi:ubiquinone/menaquinone biosynthesis C-methylase UbiE
MDQVLPAVVRDSKTLMSVPLKILFGEKAEIFLNFKDRAFQMSDKEFAQVYEDISDCLLQGETDLNSECIDKIITSISGSTVLEAGCGRGFLADKLSQKYSVTACDIVIEDGLSRKYQKVKFVEANIEDLPFKTGEFDTVVCTHTLEHVRNIQKALQELRRVAKKRLIIVVPKQRPYRYTFNLHLHFFPYRWSLFAILGHRSNSRLEDLGDWFYYENLNA